mgnify:CR=1 FL=1
MGLLDGTDRDYYQGRDHGNYQFTSLDEIITQFEIAYVGEDKIISRVRRADIAFHAQRALQELSFDTFKSTKAHEISLPPSLSMILPRDYVNYTKISTVDSAGIKHPLYPINSTSNPFNVKQLDDGSYSFLAGEELINNSEFDASLNETWEYSPAAGGNAGAHQGWEVDDSPIPIYSAQYKKDKVGIVGGQLQFESFWFDSHGVLGWGRTYGVWQEVDVAHADLLDLSAVGTSAESISDNEGLACKNGVIRVGVSSKSPTERAAEYGVKQSVGPYSSTPKVIADAFGAHTQQYSVHDNPAHLDLGYIEWNDGTTSQKELIEIPVDKYDRVWVWIQSHSPWQEHAIGSYTSLVHPDYDPDYQPTSGPYVNFKAGQGWNIAPGYELQPSPNVSTFFKPSINAIDSVKMTTTTQPNTLRGSADGKSVAQRNYSSIASTNNNTNEYTDDTYWPLDGSRFGLDPQQSQANGSFYIDTRLGKINFSSNISGKTVILDYISDSLGTDEEMQVHKFAEEAMYKWIAHAILSTRANVQEYVVQRFKKERFAAIRTAKLRLSNIKLEEITQILRGKSKQLKH